MLNRRWNIVLSLPQGLIPGGMTTWAIRTARALWDRRCNVVIAAHDSNSPTPPFQPDEVGLPSGVAIQRLPSMENPEGWQRCLDAYKRLLPAVVIPTTIEQSFELAAALAAEHAEEIRVVGWNHSDHAYDYACLSHIEPVAARFIANTSACAEQLSLRMPHRADDIVQVPHVIDAHAYPRFNTENQPLRIGYAGRLESSAKRVHDLIDTAVRLLDRDIPFVMEIAGEGPERNRIAERIRGAQSALSGMRSEIQLHSAIAPHRMNTFWQRCDCLLLPSAYEGLNYQMLEAMANGCVPIVSAIGSGPSDFIRHDTNGFTFDVGELDAATSLLKRLARDRRLLLRLALNARKTIVEQCNPATTTDLVHDVIRLAIESPARAWPDRRPISMRATQHATDEVRDASKRMSAALRDAATRGWRKVAIYGTGQHTRSIANTFAESPVGIEAFIDDDPAVVGNSLWNWPIVSREQAQTMPIDAVIISSRMNEPQILHHRPVFNSAGIELIPLYARPSLVNERSSGSQQHCTTIGGASE